MVCIVHVAELGRRMVSRLRGQCVALPREGCPQVAEAIWVVWQEC